MRTIIYGAGGVGGVIGGFMHLHGQDVVLVARGAHYEALARSGMELRSPNRHERLDVPVVDHPRHLQWRPDDVVMLTMKSQDTVAALDDLVACGYRGPVVSAQNGVANERMALRRFERVYGLCVMLPATFLEPGVVLSHSDDSPGLLDLGRYPAGVDEVAEDLAAAMEASEFLSTPDPAVMDKKYDKLLMNLGNSLDAACGRVGRESPLAKGCRAEGRAVLQAAGIAWAPQDPERRARVTIKSVGEDKHKGSSSWQSLARGTGSIEADFLNGEIVLLGRLHGVPTPVNAMLQDVANEMARERRPPGSYTVEELSARLG